MNNTNIISDLTNNWLSVPGRTIEFTYFSAITPENPSGNTNIEKATYYEDNHLLLTNTYEWNADDDPVKITSL